MELNRKLIINNKFAQKYKSGYPLLSKEALLNANAMPDEGQLAELVDEAQRYVGTAYIGKQNKGDGWILSNNPNEKIDESFFINKISNALQKRRTFFNDPNTTCFRVFNGEGDGIGGLTIDYFAEYYLITWYSKGIYTFKNMIISALQQLVTYKGTYQKKRFADQGKYVEEDDFVTGKRGDFPLIVKENGVNFAVDLNDGAMVGIFLDQRDVRQTIKEKYVKDKEVLNTFSYTGAFSVVAALGGAKKTTSVDLAKRSLPKTIEQFQVNDINPKQHDIIVMDVFNYFSYAQKKNKQFDLVILDPPSFARSKKHTFSSAKDYPDLLKQAIAITAPNGIIVASTNASNFGMERFHQFIKKAFQKSKRKYTIIEQFTLPNDFRAVKTFPEGNYLKVVFIQMND